MTFMVPAPPCPSPPSSDPSTPTPNFEEPKGKARKQQIQVMYGTPEALRNAQ